MFTQLGTCIHFDDYSFYDMEYMYHVQYFFNPRLFIWFYSFSFFWNVNYFTFTFTFFSHRFLYNCNQHPYKYYVCRKLILLNCFPYNVCVGLYDCDRNIVSLAKQDLKKKTLKSGVQRELLFFSHFYEKCNWIKHVNDYYNNVI